MIQSISHGQKIRHLELPVCEVSLGYRVNFVSCFKTVSTVSIV